MIPLSREMDLLMMRRTPPAPGGGIPTRGLVLWHPCAEALDTLPTGQAVTATSGYTYATVSGIPCATASNGTHNLKVTDGTGIPVGSDPRTLSAWIMRKVTNAVRVVGWGTTSQSGGFMFRASSSSIQAPPYNDGSIPATANVWYHVCATYSGGVTRQYVGGQLFGTVARTLETSAISSTNAFMVGATSWQYGYSIAGIRVYNRALSASEVAALAAEYTPTT